MNYLYILRCKDGSLYTGITKDLRRRMEAHFYGKKEGAKYTRSRKPQELCMVWTTPNWQDACRLEYYIKTLTKAQKEKLIREPSGLQADYHARKKRKAKDNDDIYTVSCKVFDLPESYPRKLSDFLEVFLS